MQSGLDFVRFERSFKVHIRYARMSVVTFLTSFSVPQLLSEKPEKISVLMGPVFAQCSLSRHKVLFMLCWNLSWASFGLSLMSQNAFDVLLAINCKSPEVLQEAGLAVGESFQFLPALTLQLSA